MSTRLISNACAFVTVVTITCLATAGVVDARQVARPTPHGMRHGRRLTSILAGGGKIQHVVIIMQENRSFDSYFGTFPGADGIPPGTCVPDPVTAGCDTPFHDVHAVNYGGPHTSLDALKDIDGGKMDGFVSQAQPKSAPRLDVMGYHTDAEIPRYWSYASQFTLQDHMFEPVHSWSRPSHNFLVSGWNAYCRVPTVPSDVLCER